MVLQSFKICVNAFIFDVVKTVGSSLKDLHTATHIHIPHYGSPPNSTLLFLHYNKNINTRIHTVLRIENITILPTVFTTSKIKAFTQILKDCRTM
jgi:hypothetical protein